MKKKIKKNKSKKLSLDKKFEPKKSEPKLHVPKKVKKTGASCSSAYAIIAIVLIAFAVSLYFIGIKSSVSQDVEYSISEGATITSVANDLQSKGFIESKEIFKALVVANGGQVKLGVYDIPKGASIWRVAETFARGRVATIDIVIPEGLTVRQINKLLEENEFLTGYGCVFNDHGASLGGSGFLCPPEGSLFPDTYRVAKGTARMSVFLLMQTKMQKIESKWESTGDRLPRPLKDWNDVIILASIVQKETPKASEMPIVASVYLNRLRKGMRLQADPTVVYAITNRLGDMQGKPLWINDLKKENPYNTYLNFGLPPSPIANVGMAAIKAVLNPADTSYLFFVADGMGGHVFSRNYEEHTANREAWRQIKKSKN